MSSGRRAVPFFFISGAYAGGIVSSATTHQTPFTVSGRTSILTKVTSISSSFGTFISVESIERSETVRNVSSILLMSLSVTLRDPYIPFSTKPSY